MDDAPRQLTIEQLDTRQNEVLAQLETLERQIDRMLRELRPDSPDTMPSGN
jgi:hypothetical protein